MKKIICILCVVINAYVNLAVAEPTSVLTPWDGVLDRSFNVSKSEWWYTIGFLSGTNQNGKERHFGFMVNVVRGADLYVSPLFWVQPSTSLQILLVDLDNQTHFTTQEKALGPDLQTFSVASTDLTQFAKRGNDSSSGTLLAHFRVASPDFALDLTEAPLKPQAAFGAQGIVNNASLGKAVYVSRTRQEIQSGSVIQIQNERIEVTGLSWEDHQLTDIAQGKPVKWNWFAILLADGSEVMAYQIENANTGQVLKNYAGHVLQNGQVENLDGQFSVAEGNHANFSGLQVPVSWTISLPGIFAGNIRHAVPLPSVPVTAGQIKGNYFEGPCEIQSDTGSTKFQAVWAEYFNGGLFK